MDRRVEPGGIGKSQAGNRPQGWIYPVVLLDEAMVGVREYDQGSTVLMVKVEMFTAPSDRVKREIEFEAARLGKFLQTEVSLAYLNSA